MVRMSACASRRVFGPMLYVRRGKCDLCGFGGCQFCARGCYEQFPLIPAVKRTRSAAGTRLELVQQHLA